MRPPFIYFGGKQRIGAEIAGLLPSHTHYVEPFAGSLAVLLNKEPARLETVNDLDGDLRVFWRVLRDRREELVRVCVLTPHSRVERETSWIRSGDLTDVERARRVWVCLTQGRTGTLRNTGWRFDTADHANTSMPSRLDGYVNRMHDVGARLRSVSLESRPAVEVIAAYGQRRHTLLYVDPPYFSAGRSQNYRHEMASEHEHRALAAALHFCHATVVLSGYASTLYDEELYATWYRHEILSSTSQGGTMGARTEVLWSNRPLAASTTDRALIESPSFRNDDSTVRGECNEARCAVPECRKALTQPVTGRRRTYCSTACRVRAHRATSNPESDSGSNSVAAAVQGS